MTASGLGQELAAEEVVEQGRDLEQPRRHQGRVADVGPLGSAIELDVADEAVRHDVGGAGEQRTQDPSVLNDVLFAS